MTREYRMFLALLVIAEQLRIDPEEAKPIPREFADKLAQLAMSAAYNLSHPIIDGDRDPHTVSVAEINAQARKTTDPVPPLEIAGDTLRAALHQIRIEFAYVGYREFPMHGMDALLIMAAHGLCTQAEADAACTVGRSKMVIAEAQQEREHTAPLEPEGMPVDA